MFCKYCGKEITDDSRFCKFCGNLIEEQDCVTTNDEPTIENRQKVEVVLSTDDSSPVQVELTHKPIIKKVTFANEVIANIKMIGIAILLWLAYIICFSIYRAGDISTTSNYGASYYDGNMSGNWEFEWERHYVRSIYFFKLKASIINGRLDISSLPNYELYTPEACLREADRLAKEKNISSKELEDLEAKAKLAAEKAQKNFMDEVYTIRKHRFENEREEHMKWAAIILLLLTVLGRYIVNFFKWVITTAETENKNI